jgi:hypothetical protein
MPDGKSLATWLPCGHIGFYEIELGVLRAFMPERDLVSRTKRSRVESARDELRRAFIAARELVAARLLHEAGITPQSKVEK